LKRSLAIRTHPLALSFGLHLGLLGVWFGLMLFSVRHQTQKIDFEVIEFPKFQNKAAQPHLKVEEEKQPAPEPKKAVFGLSRKAVQSVDANDKNAVQVKAGNTVAKEPDQRLLDKDDPDSLPIPTDDYLVSTMPQLKSEFKIPYPAEAKAAGIEGPVVMDILIDNQGMVRKVDLVKGPGYGLNEAALQAITHFQFAPAQVQGQAVAVKIRYTYRFVLEVH
jgi:TonB family protein